MKKIVFFSFLIIFVLSFTSCDHHHRHQTRVTEQQFRVVEPDFFYVVKYKVISGDTTWDRAKVYYGSGFKWTDIVAQNKFLQQPGRVWQDPVNKKWYVLIYPGEELIMGSTKVNPIFIDTIDSPVVNTKDKEDDEDFFTSIPWWDILVALALIGLTIWAVVSIINCCRQRGFSSSNSSSSSAIRVNINQPGCIDLETRRALLEREQGFRDRTLKVIEDGATNGRLKEFFVAENSETFLASGSFRNQTAEPKKEEDKK